MKMEGREPICTVMIGPCLAWRVLRKGSSWEIDFWSNWKFVMIGMCRGPGGRGTVVVKKERMALIRKMMQRVTRMMNHV